MPYCIYSKDKKPLQIHDFYEDAAMEAAEVDGAYVVEITDEEADYIENDISDYKYFKNNYGEDEDGLDFERSWGPKDDGDDFEDYMLPLLACYYYDKPGKYKIDFNNRQFGSEYKALVEIIGNGTFRIIKERD